MTEPQHKLFENGSLRVSCEKADQMAWYENCNGEEDIPRFLQDFCFKRCEIEDCDRKGDVKVGEGRTVAVPQEAASRDGSPFRTKKRHFVKVRMSQLLFQALNAMAEKKGVNRSVLVRHYIREGLKEE